MKTLKFIRLQQLSVLFALTAMFLVLLCFSACNGNTSPKTCTFVGRVVLDNDSGDSALDPTDYSGIRVSLYELAVIDSVMQNAKSVFSGGGFPINQNSEFDHRDQTEVLHVFTNPDGSFKIPKVPYGEYNLVIRKDGWGYRYLYEIEINAEQIDLNHLLSKPGEMKLYPEIVVSGSIEGSHIIRDWHHLVISGDATFTPASSLTIGDNGVVRIEPGKKLDVMGLFNARGSAGNMFRITSDAQDFIKTSERASTSSYLRFNLGASTQTANSSIAWGNFGPAQSAVAMSNIDNLTFEKCRFVSNNDGLLGSICRSISVKESFFKGQSNLNNALHYYMVDAGVVSGNIFLFSRAGMLLEEFCSQTIEDNVFINNEYGIEMFNCDPVVRYNYFRKNDNGIRLTGRISPTVERNYIDSNTGILIGFNGYYPNAIPSIHHNNMVAGTYFFYLRAANYIDIEAQNNYYYTTSIPEIEQKIYDKYDYPENLQFQVSQILYSPFSMNKIPGAMPRI